MAIAKTDYNTHWDFSDAAENYRIETQKFLNEHFANSTKYGDWGWKADADFWKQLPKFDYDPPSLAQTIQTNSSSIIIMLIWCIGSFTLLFFTTKSL